MGANVIPLKLGSFAAQNLIVTVTFPYSPPNISLPCATRLPHDHGCAAGRRAGGLLRWGVWTVKGIERARLPEMASGDRSEGPCERIGVVEIQSLTGRGAHIVSGDPDRVWGHGKLD